MIGNRLFSRGTAKNGGPLGNYRVPSHRPSLRRRSKILIVVAVLLIPAAYITYLFLDPVLPPMGALDNAKWALEGAAKAGALRYSEKTYRAAEEQMQAGWMEMARQNGRLAPFRDYRVADSMLGEAYQTAMRAAKETGQTITNLESTTLAERADYRDELANWEDALNGSLAKLDVARYYKSAELSLATCDRLIAAKEYQEARESMALGRVWLQKLATSLNSYDNDGQGEIRTWRRWVQETLDDSRADGGNAVIVNKAAHKLYLVKAGRIIKTFDAELGYNSAHQKTFAGDGATPEGKYQVTVARPRGSRYYKALLINYPNDADKHRFQDNKARGVISARSHIGSLIEIHGEGGRGKDWTEGCVALTNHDMDQLMQYVGAGTPVTIVRKSDQWP